MFLPAISRMKRCFHWNKYQKRNSNIALEPKLIRAQHGGPGYRAGLVVQWPVTFRLSNSLNGLDTCCMSRTAIESIAGTKLFKPRSSTLSVTCVLCFSCSTRISLLPIEGGFPYIVHRIGCTALNKVPIVTNAKC